MFEKWFKENNENKTKWNKDTDINTKPIFLKSETTYWSIIGTAYSPFAVIIAPFCSGPTVIIKLRGIPVLRLTSILFVGQCLI